MLVKLLPLLIPASALVFCAATARADDAKAGTVHDFSAQSIDGQEVSLSQYKGKVLLIVNTASKCGYTPQYKGLQAVYDKYKDQGLEVLAFPANEFGRQEPGSNAEIKTFCTERYSTSFPLFSKIVVKGQGQHPLYQYLTSKDTNPEFAGDIPWNFAKFLVDKNGHVIARFAPGDEPESEKVEAAIEKALAAK